jgi:peptide/nickel transport system permease protein
MGVAGLLILLGALFVAIFAPQLSRYDPYGLSSEMLQAPSAAHPMGTDHLGRDTMSGIMHGIRLSLLFAVVVAGLSSVFGVVLGAIPGYWGGSVDDIFCRFFDIFLMIPSFFLIILVVAMFGSNIWFTMLIVGLTDWPSNARLVRSQVLSLKTRQFVLAAIGSGGSSLFVLFRHILPNGLYPVVANSALQMGAAILTEAGLSFLGLGDPNQLSLGQILHSAQNHIEAWWLAFFPGVAIAVLVLAFNLIGDGINFVFNPMLREKKL